MYVGRLSSGTYYSFRDYFTMKVVDILNTGYMRLNFVNGDEGYGDVSSYYKARVILSTMMMIKTIMADLFR